MHVLTYLIKFCVTNDEARHGCINCRVGFTFGYSGQNKFINLIKCRQFVTSTSFGTKNLVQLLLILFGGLDRGQWLSGNGRIRTSPAMPCPRKDIQEKFFLKYLSS